MKTFKITVTQEELERIIKHHAAKIQVGYHDVETSERIHNLTKRLNKDTPEIEIAKSTSPIGGLYDDPFTDDRESPQLEAAKTEQQSSW